MSSIQSGRSYHIVNVGHNMHLTSCDFVACISSESDVELWKVLACPHESDAYYLIDENTGKFLDTDGTTVSLRTHPLDSDVETTIANDTTAQVGSIRWRLIECPCESEVYCILNTRHQKSLYTHGKLLALWLDQDLEQTIRRNTSQHAGNIQWKFCSFSTEHNSGNELLPRTFVPCSGGRDGPGLVIMQFNVLADGLAQNQFYARVPADKLAFNYRQTLALKEVERISPDILCMEEVNHFESWQDRLEALGYTGHWIPKYDGSYPRSHQTPPSYYGGQPTDGCAIFLKTSRLFFHSQVGRRFAELAEAPEITQVLLTASVGSNSTGQYVLTVSVSHLKAGVGAANAEMRRLQGSAWVEELHRFQSEEDVPGPIVLCGDMNESAIHEGVSQLCSGLMVSSVYAEGLGQDPECTCIDGNWRGCLDHILVSRGVLPLAVWEVPALPDGALPSSLYPSDHLAIAAKLDIDIDSPAL